jgi:hypothetical protein
MCSSPAPEAPARYYRLRLRDASIADRAGRSGTVLSPLAGAVYSLGMKITRLKRGYRIGLNDGEFDALSLLVQYGLEARDE